MCLTEASQGCPDWPACYGRLLPPPRLDSILEYTHRVMAGLTSLLILGSAIAGQRRYRAIRWLSRPPAIALAFLLAVVVFGAMAVLRGLPPGLAALDLGAALVVQALVVTAAVVAVARHKSPTLPDHLSLDSRLARLALWTVVATWIVLVSGVLVAGSASPMRCLGWPLYGGRLDLAGVRTWLQGARAIAGWATVLLVAVVVIQAWRGQPPESGQRAVRRVATVLAVLLAAELLTGALLVLAGPALLLQVAHVALTAALWAALVALLVVAGMHALPADKASP